MLRKFLIQIGFIKVFMLRVFIWSGLTTEEALELLKKTYFEPLQNKKIEVIVEDKKLFS